MKLIYSLTTTSHFSPLSWTLISCGAFLLIIYLVLRHQESNRLKKKLKKRGEALFVQYASPLEKTEKPDRALLGDGLLFLGQWGYQCYRWYTSDSAESLRRRFPNDGFNKIWEHFHKLADKANHGYTHILRADIGENLSFKEEVSKGFNEQWPLKNDGTWKSNQEGWDHYHLGEDGNAVFINDKVGYENNFETVLSDAKENPGTIYRVGSEHAQAIYESGLDNIESRDYLSADHIDHVISQNADAAHESAGHGPHVPWISIGRAIWSHSVLVFNAQESVQEGLFRGTSKVVALKGGALVGAKAGAAMGAPFGALGAALGAFLGAIGGASLFKRGLRALYGAKAVELLKEYVQVTIDASIEIQHCTMIAENQHKKTRRALVPSLKCWLKHLVWPVEEVMERALMREAARQLIKQLASENNKVKKFVKALRKTREDLNSVGFVGRLFMEDVKLQKEVMAIGSELDNSIVKLVPLINLSKRGENLLTQTVPNLAAKVRAENQKNAA